MYIPKTGALKSIQQQCGMFYEGMEGGTGKKHSGRMRGRQTESLINPAFLN